jgi:catechol 2,3-dioxygenase-like lactoylglutathione lyase family enzyme
LTTIGLEGLDHVALLVRDQKRSIAWYRDVLGRSRAQPGATVTATRWTALLP